MTPMNNRVLVEPYKKSNRTEKGLYLPDNRKEAEMADSGEVLSVPQKCVTKTGVEYPCPVKKGDLILFNPHRALPCDIGFDHYLFVNIDDIQGVVDE